jgi:two-component system sensor histidine kinase QseC
MRPRWWWRWLRPTLVRRLMVAQVLLLGLLWTLLIGFVVIDGADTAGTMNELRIYDAVIGITEDLADAPQAQQQSLRAIERVLRADFDSGLLPELAPILQVWQGGRLVYHSEGALPVVKGSGREGIEKLAVEGVRWRLRMRTHLSSRSSTRVEMLTPSSPWDLFITFNSRGYYLMPLMVSLPFLLLPAWLSIRLALRPWSQVAQEVAARGPQDLTPLAFQPAHLELAAMVDSVNALLARVANSAQRERSFIADAAHELRTPLAAMRVNVEALQARTSEPGQRELLSGILNSGDRAARLVGQLLLLMRNDTTAGGLRQPLALDALLQERLAALSGLGTRGGVELALEVERGVEIVGQREALTSLIDNLVDNAIKYSPPRGAVTVGLALEGASAVLSVRDQGPGIAPALRERVFDRFFRDPQQTQSGSGLGLAIARSAAQLHGGTITLFGAPGGGLLVRVWLPLAPPASLGGRPGGA